MKWNWGTKIALSFFLFGVFILYMVVQAFRQDFDLVTENYYQEELQYQERIQEKANLLRSGDEIIIESNVGDVLFKFPESFSDAEGTIYFYHPSRKLFDKTFQVDLNDQNQQSINRDELVRGRYKVKVSWQVGGLSYFQEKELYLQ
tara:strand:+ start:1130 stop:1567 length:438 start_codon:yes stop_codon:yes gene_type:complete